MMIVFPAGALDIVYTAPGNGTRLAALVAESRADAATAVRPTAARAAMVESIRFCTKTLLSVARGAVWAGDICRAQDPSREFSRFQAGRVGWPAQPTPIANRDLGG
jgi:hypothetical protein